MMQALSITDISLARMILIIQPSAKLLPKIYLGVTWDNFTDAHTCIAGMIVAS